MPGIERRPNLLCIGAPKCGTTWLAEMLGAHSEIEIPAQKELNVLHYDDCDQRIDEYNDYFQSVAQWRGDFSVRYLDSDNAPNNAKHHLADDLRVLCVLRDPVEQMNSHYWHLRRQNFHQAQAVVPVPSLIEAIERAGGGLLQEVSVFDVYTGDRVSEEKKSVAFGLRFGAHRTLKDKEVDAKVKAVIKALNDGFGAELRQ